MIPNILWQTWKTNDIPSSLYGCVQSWKDNNPQLERRFMNDQEAADFIQQEFGEEVYKIYQALPLGVMRADFWRLAVVYIYGGYYADLDVQINTNLVEWVDNTTEAVFLYGLHGDIENWFFASYPKHPIIKRAIDNMISHWPNILNNKQELIVQNFGMAWIAASVKVYIKNNTGHTITVLNESVVGSKGSQQLIHYTYSLQNINRGESWRTKESKMKRDRNTSQEILFFTTFHKPGYELYGKTWINSFIQLSNYYNKFKALVFYQGFEPDILHPNITYVDYDKTFPQHAVWKSDFNAKSKHNAWVKKNSIRFSHKAFVIAHVLSTYNNDYLIWLDGDTVFKKAVYNAFPKDVLNNCYMACQQEQGSNHVESGVLIFDGKHVHTKSFAKKFQENYNINKLLTMGEPYDGFVVYKTTQQLGHPFLDLNAEYGKHGIQSDPNLTFLNPHIADKFTHNIGPGGKTQYDNWENIQYNEYDVWQQNQTILKVAVVTGSFHNMSDTQINSIKKAKKFGQITCIALHSDLWCERNTKEDIVPFEQRAKHIKSLKLVDHVISFEDSDNTIENALLQVRNLFPNAKIFVFNSAAHKTKVAGVKFMGNV